MNGRIFTFYSWKGGVGRTMAIANVGVQLARRGKRVLLVDWDLEAPGLDRYFVAADRLTASKLKLTPATDKSGLLGLLSDAARGKPSDAEAGTWESRCLTVVVPAMQKATRSEPAPSAPVPLRVLPAGIGSAEYANNLQTFSLASFFADSGGAQWLERLREEWREAFDFVLIDSRTGLTDSGGVCTVQMPDAAVFVFTANSQSLEDGVKFLVGVQKARATFAFERAPLTIIPLLARWEGDREVDLADAWLERIESVIAPFVDSWLPSDIPRLRLLERLRVPHVARFSFGEPLPVLTHSLTDTDRPGLAYDLLAELLVGGFSDAGRIIEPNYRPPFDPVQASDAELDALVIDEQAREAAMAGVAARHGEQSIVYIELLIRLAESGIRTGKLPVADQIVLRALPMVRGRARESGDDVANEKMLVGVLLIQADIRRALGNLVEARLGFGQALEIIKVRAEAAPSDNSWHRFLSVILDRLGDVLRDQGDLGGALSAYRESLQVRERLAATDPANPPWLRDLSVSCNNVGHVLRDQGDLGGALASYRESLAVIRRLTATNPSHAGWQRDLSVSCNNVGNVLRGQGDLAGALASYRESLDVIQRLAAADPSNAGWQRNLSVSCNNVGNVLRDQGDLTGALAAYRESLRVMQHLAATDPSNASWQRDLSVSQNNVGRVLRDQGELAGALAAYKESLQVTERLAVADPSNAGWQRDLSVNQEKVGNVLHDLGDLTGALGAYRESLQARQRLAAADPSNATWQRDFSVSLDNVGSVLHDQGDLAGALAAYRESLQARERLAAADPSNATVQRDLFYSFDQIARLLADEGKTAQALEPARQSLAIAERLSTLDPTNAIWRKDVEVSRRLVARLEADQPTHSA